MPVLPAVPLKAQPTSPDPADVLLLQQVKLLYAGLPVSQAVTLLNGVVLAAVQSVRGWRRRHHLLRHKEWRF